MPEEICKKMDSNFLEAVQCIWQGSRLEEIVAKMAGLKGWVEAGIRMSSQSILIRQDFSQLR
jgi:hypothetical protein